MHFNELTGKITQLSSQYTVLRQHLKMYLKIVVCLFIQYALKARFVYNGFLSFCHSVVIVYATS